MREWREPNSTSRHEAEHRLEAAVNAWGFARARQGQPRPPALPTTLTLDELAPAARRYRQAAHAAHLHTWTLRSLRAMLREAARQLPRDVAFDVLDANSYHGPAAKPGLNRHDWELRVALRRR